MDSSLASVVGSEDSGEVAFRLLDARCVLGGSPFERVILSVLIGGGGIDANENEGLLTTSLINGVWNEGNEFCQNAW